MKAFLFPGQGSQEVGMGADLFGSDEIFREMIRQASRCVGEDLERLCLRGPERRLQRSAFLQPLLVAVSLGYLRHLTAAGVRADVVCGHSLGEITALAAAGVVSFEEAVTIAARRGELMDAAAARVQGGMSAVTTLHREKCLEILASSGDLTVVLANDNAPAQIVLSGELSALQACGERIRTAHAGRCRALPVAGPWHSPFMREARDRFREWVRPLNFRAPAIDLVCNATAARATEPDHVKELVTRILAEPVRWRESMDHLRQLGVTELFEVGPGRVLAGLARANGFGEESRVLSVNNLRGVDLAARAEGSPVSKASSHSGSAEPLT